jgi:hypothetical protein
MRSTRHSNRARAASGQPPRRPPPPGDAPARRAARPPTAAPGRRALRLEIQAVQQARRSLRAYGQIVRVVVAGLQGLLRELPAVPEPFAEVLREAEGGYSARLYPALDLEDNLGTEVAKLSHQAWSLERMALGLPGDLQEGETSPADKEDYYPALTMPADPDPAAATRRELAAYAGILRLMLAEFGEARARLKRAARNARASKRARRAAAELERLLAAWSSAHLKPAVEGLDELLVARGAEPEA